MNRLHTEMRRLYAAPTEPSTAPWPPSTAPAAAGCYRALVVGLGRPARWADAAALWSGVQDVWGWPAPAIAVDGQDGYQLWFSLAEAVPQADAQRLIQAMWQRFVPDVEPERLRAWPQPEGVEPMAAWPWVPAEQASGGLWSAYVAPGLAAVLEQEPWLDMAPSVDAQADLLCRLDSVPADQVDAVLASISEQPEEPTPALASAEQVPVKTAHHASGRTPAHPEALQFLRSVMHDPNADLALRIEAAKALLPYA